MKLNDLKAGYLVITNENDFYLVTETNSGLALLGNNDYVYLNLYKQDLTHKREVRKNIRAIYGFTNADGLYHLYNPKHRKLLFSRVGSGWGVVLSTYELGILTGLHQRYRYIARDHDGKLYVFTSRPFYVGKELRFNVGSEMLSLDNLEGKHFRGITHQSGIHPIKNIIKWNEEDDPNNPDVDTLNLNEWNLGDITR